MENRTERAEKLKRFATGQFQNFFQFESDIKSRDIYANSSQFVKHILSLDAPKRQYKRKEAGPDDEKTRVRITLLEYGNKSLIAPSFGINTIKKSESDVDEDELSAEVSEFNLFIVFVVQFFSPCYGIKKCWKKDLPLCGQNFKLNN